MNRLSRRNMMKGSVAGGAAGLFSAAADFEPTPKEVEGPFYPVVEQQDKDFDLTQVKGKAGTAAGEVVMIEGRIVDTNGQAVEGAVVDLWQANAKGRYRHPGDPNAAPLDPNFQGWAIVPSGKDGGFRFKTVVPGAYPAAKGWVRPPHIHFKVSKRGYVELITQMYFPGEALNEKDRLLQRHKEADQALMIAEKVDGKIPTYKWEIVIEEA